MYPFTQVSRCKIVMILPNKSWDFLWGEMAVSSQKPNLVSTDMEDTIEYVVFSCFIYHSWRHNPDLPSTLSALLLNSEHHFHRILIRSTKGNNVCMCTIMCKTTPISACVSVCVSVCMCVCVYLHVVFAMVCMSVCICVCTMVVSRHWPWLNGTQ